MEVDKKTWEDLRDAVLSGIIPDHDGNLLPEDTPLADKIILLELARKIAIASGLDLSALETRKDFAEWVADRRSDPTWDQWLYLTASILLMATMICLTPSVVARKMCSFV